MAPFHFVARPPLIVAVVVLVNWGLITHGTFAGSGDEPHYLIIAHSLAFDHDLDLTNDYADATVITSGTLQPGPHAETSHGLLRPVHDIGMPLLFAPIVRVLYPLADFAGRHLPAAVLRAAKLNSILIFRHMISLCMSLLAGLLVVELWRCFAELNSPAPLGWALLFGLSPPILAHSFLFFTEILSALIALALFRRLAFTGLRGRTEALVAGLATGYLALVHIRNIGLIAGLSVLVLLALWRKQIALRHCLAYAGGVVVFLLVRTAVTYHLWGTLVTTPHAPLGAQTSPATTATEVFIRFTGLLFDREYGLLVYAPIYVLSGAGLIVLRRTRPLLFHSVVVVAGLYLLPVLLPALNVHGWNGAWSPPARFLVPVVPLLALAAYASASEGARWLVGLLCAWQVVLDAYVWQFPKTLWNDGDGIGALFLSPAFPSWAEPSSAATFALFLIMTLALSWWLARLSRTRSA